MARPRLDAATKRAHGTFRADREPVSASLGPRDVVEDVKNVQLVVEAKNYVALADGYIEDVTSGRITAGGWIRKACRRFVRMRGRAAAAESRFIFSVERANAVCAFAEKCPHVEGRWGSETISLQAWQVFVLVACYGFRSVPDGCRLVTSVFFQVSRKSAKSTLVAIMALYHLAYESEPGAQVVCGATTGSQARIVFGIMRRMVQRSAWLRGLGFTAWAHSVTFKADGTAKPINAKSSSQDGLNPSFISLDESHAQDFTLHDVLKSAQGARANPMLVAPTTAGHNLTSVGFALRTTAIKILDDVVESDHTFVALYELDPEDDWRDESVWAKACPMLGITPSLEYVRKYRDDALATPGLAGEFEVKICNRWLHSVTTWLSVPAWDACADHALTLDAFSREACWIGADLAERDDVAAVALVFQRDGVLYVFVRGYLPEQVVTERSRAVPEYRAWVQSGELITTPGNMTDHRTIEADIRLWCDQFDVRSIVVERYGALQLAANLCEMGLPARIESKNAKTFTTPAKELEARIKAKRIRHNGSTFLKWQISNACVERRRDGSLLPTKDRAESPNKIDAVDAVALALIDLLQAPTSPLTIYDRPDFDPAMAWI